MVSVQLWTDRIFWFECEGCGSRIVDVDPDQIGYEHHSGCYTNDPHLVDKARASGVSDIYTYLADRVEVRGVVLSDLSGLTDLSVPPTASLTAGWPPGYR